MNGDTHNLLLQNLNNNIQLLATHLTQIEYLSNQIGSINDTNELRDELVDWQNKAKKVVSDAQENFKELINIPNSNSYELKTQKERLADELIRSVCKFQNLIHESLRREKENLDQETNSTFMFQNNGNEEITDRNLNILKINLDEITQVKDRDSQLFQMETDINYLNSVMRDMALTIQDQHETLEKIEVTIDQNMQNPNQKIFQINPFVDPVIKEFKEKVAFFIALVIFFTIFSIVLLALFI